MQENLGKRWCNNIGFHVLWAQGKERKRPGRLGQETCHFSGYSNSQFSHPKGCETDSCGTASVCSGCLGGNGLLGKIEVHFTVWREDQSRRPGIG